MSRLNPVLDRLLRPFTFGWPTWRVCVFGGMLLGMGLAMGLATAVGLSPWVAGGAALAGVLACGAIGLGKAVLTGVENYTFYHYQMGVLAVTAVLLAVTHQPLLAYLDLIAVALAAALACGRLGCQAGGCCHGRPHEWGVCYAERPYAALDFTPHLLGVRLFPVQLVESVWLWLIVVSGSGLILAGQAAGSALAWYVVGYGGGRFCLEFWRGDGERPYLGPLSTAQWTCLVWLGAAALAEWRGLLPFTGWHGAAIIGCAGVAGFRLLPNRQAQQAITAPAHVREIAQALALADSSTMPTVCVQRTTLGYRFSGQGGEEAALYTVSHENGGLTRATAVQLANLIVCLRHPGQQTQILPGPQNIFHILVTAEPEPLLV